ncbi:MAG: phytase [bacterium]
MGIAMFFGLLLPCLAFSQSKNIWMSAAELAERPTHGMAWQRLVTAADSVDNMPVLGGHNSVHDVYTMASALVAVRLDDDRRRRITANNIMKAVNHRIQNDGNSLSLTRSLTGYILAADLIDLKSVDADKDERFRRWLERMVYRLRLDNATQVEKHEIRGNNHGTQAGVVRIAASIYLEKQGDLQRAAEVFKGWLGDSASYRGFNWGNLCWQMDPQNPVGILPKGATMFIAGDWRDVDGLQPDDQRRAGCPDSEHSWPISTDSHVWGGLQGAVGQAYLLSRAGYDAWNWQNQAVLRAVSWQQDPLRGDAPAMNDDLWVLPLIDHFFGTQFWDGYPVGFGKQVGWTDWTHGGEKATQLTLKVTRTGAGQVTLQPSGPSYMPGTQVQLTAVPEPGWIFTGWDGDLEGLENPATLTMDKLKEVVAIFSETARTVTVQPAVTTTATLKDARTTVIWSHSTQPEKSVVIGLDEENIYVWDLNGNELQRLQPGSRLSGLDLRRNVMLGKQMLDIVAANLRGEGKLAIFKINENYHNSDVLIPLAGINSTHNSLQDDSYGFCLYKRATDGALFAFDRPKSGGNIRQYRIDSAGTQNKIVLNPLRELNYGGGTAYGLVADDELGYLYVAEVAKGVHKYPADPDKGHSPLTFFAREDGIAGGRQGLALYACNDGEGYLILSSQGNSTLKIYDRKGDNAFLKTIILNDASGAPGLQSEGIAVTSYNAAANFPSGFLVAPHKVTGKFHFYDWGQIAKPDLKICVDGVPVPEPILSVWAESYDFGEAFIGTSLEQIFEIKNNGTGTLTIMSISLLDNDLDEFVLDSLQTPVHLAPDSALELSVKFRPVSAGEEQIKLRVLSDDVSHSPLLIPLTGRGLVPNPELMVKPDTLDFGKVAVDSIATQNLTMTNSGNFPLIVKKMRFVKGDTTKFHWVTSVDSLHLAAGSSKVLSMNYAPEIAGFHQTVVRFFSNDGDSSEFDLQMRGTAFVPLPQIIVKPQELDFGRVNIGVDSLQFFEISNMGTLKLQILSIQLTGENTADFSKQSIPTPFSLPPNSSLPVDLSFSPQSEGPKQAALIIASDDTAHNPVEIRLSGVGNFPQPEQKIFLPISDTYARIRRENSRYGDRTELIVRAAPNDYRVYLKFDVQNLNGPIRSARIRMYCTDGGDHGGTIYSASNKFRNLDSNWNENSLNWLNAPQLTAEPLDSVGAVLTNSWVEFDVTPAFHKHGTYSFGMTLSSSNRVKYASKESVNSPKLLVVTGQVGAPTQLVRISGDDQSGIVATALAEPLVVAVLDDHGFPVKDVQVNFLVTAGGGRISENFNRLTDEAGRAAAYLVLGKLPGFNEVTVTFEGMSGNPIIFKARALPLPTEFSFPPSADAYVRSTTPEDNFGGVPDLRVRWNSTTELRAFLKFQVTGVAGVVQQAVLRMKVLDASVDGGAIYAVSNNYRVSKQPWQEQGINWFNAPEISLVPIDILNSVQLDDVVEWDVTDKITGNGTFSFAIKSQSGDVVKFSSKEGSQAPELFIKTANLELPQLTSFSPRMGVTGTVVTLKGQKFLNILQVLFNGTPALTFPVDSDTLLRTVVPPVAQSGKISLVTDKGVTQSDEDFVIILPPVIESFSPTRGMVGTRVTLTGRHFAGVFEAAFAAVPASDFSVVSDTAMYILVPKGAGTAMIKIRNQAGQSETAEPFTVVEPPSLLQFTPIADVYVRSTMPDRNFGLIRELRVRRTSSAAIYSFLKFDVTGVTGEIRKASLLLTVKDESVDGGKIFSVSNHYRNVAVPWQETGLIWKNAPEISGNPLSQLRSVALEEQVEFDVTAAIVGNGTYSFGMVNKTSDRVIYSSRETVNPPILVIEMNQQTTKSAKTSQSELKPSLETKSAKLSELPGAFALGSNYPNPFNAETTITYSLPQDTQVTLSIYNLLGQSVRVLVNKTETAGYKKVRWNGRNHRGQEMASGIYFVKLEVQGRVFYNKIILQK